MAATVHFYDAFENLCKKAHDNSKAHGFWDGPDVPGGNADNVSIPTKLLLIISEVAEMFEAYRKGKLKEPCDKDCSMIDGSVVKPTTKKCEMCGGRGTQRGEKCDSCDGVGTVTDTYPCRACNGVGTVHPANPAAVGVVSVGSTTSVKCLSCDGRGKHDRIGSRRLTNEEEELADMVIRIGDYCGWRRIDLGRCILAKMQYNSTRPHRHGKTC